MIGIGAALCIAGGLTGAARAGDPVAACPAGGGWQLVSASVGPAATRVDQHGNNDGYACKTIVTGEGKVVGQVIDNRVKAGS